MEAQNPKIAADYKARKEAFVSNLSGGSLNEINLVTLVAPAAILLWSALQSRQSFFSPYTPTASIVDFLLNVCAILFAITAYSSAPVLLDILLAIPAIILLLPLTSPPKSSKPSAKDSSSKKSKSLDSKASSSEPETLPVRPFLTNYRGAMLVITCLAILAVDFPVFPRRFAKAENWGTSVMDLGVGSFVFSAGVVSARSILRIAISKASGREQKPFFHRLSTSIRHSVPLIVLGLIRLYSVKGLDYAEHVTEYGVHWNFFFTLALLPPFVELSDLMTTHLKLSYDVLSLGFAVVYEIILDSTALKAYILISPRGPSLLSKNREGIFSFVGYLSIFLAGRSTGLLILSPATPSPKTRKSWMNSLLSKLLLRSAIYVLLYIASTSYGLGANLIVSRRLANLPYVLWVAAFNISQICLFAAVESAAFGNNDRNHGTTTNVLTTQKDDVRRKSSRIMYAINANGLAIFLVANLLTGLVNLTINTLDMGNVAAMGVLLAYATVLAAMALGLDMAGWRIKI